MPVEIWGPVGVLAGVVLGFVLSELKSWLSRRRRLRSLWGVLRAELEACRHQATVHNTDKRSTAPLYRLPVLAWQDCVRGLIADGQLSQSEYHDISRFFVQAQDLNRGLNLVSSFLKPSGPYDDCKFPQLYGRNVEYAKLLMRGEEGELYTAALHVVERHASLGWMTRVGRVCQSMRSLECLHQLLHGLDRNPERD